MAPFDQRPYESAQRLVDVGNGRRMNVYCTGTGSPTVILDAGLGGFTLVWSLVQPPVATFAHVCSYDRAGSGFSDPGPLPRTTDAIVSDLHALLRGADIAPPYVMVGHSLAGFDAHDELAALSKRGINCVIPGVGHTIMIEKPSVVVHAIRQAIADARTTARPSCGKL